MQASLVIPSPARPTAALTPARATLDRALASLERDSGYRSPSLIGDPYGPVVEVTFADHGPTLWYPVTADHVNRTWDKRVIHALREVIRMRTPACPTAVFVRHHGKWVAA